MGSLLLLGVACFVFPSSTHCVAADTMNGTMAFGEGKTDPDWVAVHHDKVGGCCAVLR